MLWRTDRVIRQTLRAISKLGHRIVDIRTLTKLILKLAGLYCLATVLFSVPTLVVVPKEYAGASYFGLGLYAIVGLALFWFPGLVLDNVVRVRTSEFGSPRTEALYLRIGVRLLGCYFALSAIYGLVFDYARVKIFHPDITAPDFTPDRAAATLASAVQLAAGLALWIGANHVVRATVGSGGKGEAGAEEATHDASGQP